MLFFFFAVSISVFFSVQSKEPKEEQLRRPKTSIVQSLVSPPGTHPTPSTTPDSQSRGSRKFSLIQEESIDDDEEEELMDIDPGELRPAKSVESLDDGIPWKGSNQIMPSFEPFQVKRPLVSVASSPQLLNQICEENETDVEEEDDFVPNKLHSPKLRMSRGSCASPEVLRKYEQRKKRSGSKVTSCSSSDASDTDDTEKRSRKDKLKPKFMHRRDSSDHSSDTDGGPSGPPTGGLGGGRAATGGGGKDRSSNKDRKGGGGSKGHKEGKSGGGGGKQHTHSCRSKSGETSISSAISNLSMTSINSKNSLKYIVEGDESNDSDVEDNDMKTDDKEEMMARNYIDKVCDKENKRCEEVFSLCASDCSGYQGRKVYGNRLKIKVDINRNSCCNVQDSKLHPIKIQTKCCSLV